MGVSKERAQNSAASSLRGAEKQLRRDALDHPNAPLSLVKQVSALPLFMAFETHPEPLTRWVPLHSVFPGAPTKATDEQVRKTATNLIAATEASSLDALPTLTATVHLPSEWGGEIFGTKDSLELAVYAAMGFTYVPVSINRTHHFIDAHLTLRFPSTSTPARALAKASARITKEMGLKSRTPTPRGPLAQEGALASLWRIHDCLRDFLLEGELVKDEASRQYTATIKASSLFPWLADERLDAIGEAFTTAYPRQARHGKVPSVDASEKKRRERTLPPSITSED